MCAVVINVYGKADLRQIQKAEKQLAAMKREATSGSARMRAWGGAAKQASTVAAVGFASVTGVIAKGVLEYNKLGSATSNLTKLTNISAAAASTFSGQWSRFGIDAAVGQKGLQMLSKQIEAAKDGNKTSIESFEKLGITLADLKTKSGGDIMAQVRDSMSKMAAGTERTTLMTSLFSKGGVKMLKWLDATPESIGAVNKALKEQGSIMSDQDLADWKKSAAAQADLSQAWRGFLQQAGKSVIPELTKIVGAFTRLQKVAAPLAGSLKYVAGGLALFAVGSKIASGFNAINLALKTMKGLLAGGKLAGGLADVAGGGGGFVKKGEKTIAGSLLGGGGTGAAGGAAAGSASALAAAIAPVVVIAAMTALPLVLAKTQKFVAGQKGAAAARQGQAAGGSFWGSSKGYGGGSGAARMALAEEAKKGVESINAAIKALEAKAATQTGAQFRSTFANLTSMRAAAAKP